MRFFSLLVLYTALLLGLYFWSKSCILYSNCYGTQIHRLIGELMFQWNAWYLKSGAMTTGVEDYLLWHWFGNVRTTAFQCLTTKCLN